MFKFLLFSCGLWIVLYLVAIEPKEQKLQDLKSRSSNLQIEINKIDLNLHYLKCEREDLMNNNRFYINRLSREKLRLKHDSKLD
ncbi:MAG: hypothetical protein COA79_11070 [Planctomycetota bacterium]|nr:MAG: hypothetical protein COA79_11070 [Planctomycetota bacterium]